MFSFGKKHFIGLFFGVVVAILGFVYFEDLVRNFVLVIALTIAGIPFLLSLLTGQSKEIELQEMFLVFARDLTENVKSGTPVSRSIAQLAKRDYRSLTKHVSKLSNQLSIGISLSQALEIFGKETKSKVISRAVGLISEAERAGGNMAQILESVASSVNQIENLRKERKAAISSLVTQGYIIFMIFVVIMLILEIRILPLVTDISGAEGLSFRSTAISPDDFSRPLFIMILVQSIFAGLVIGKLSEGSLMRGVKHSFILVIVTLVVTTGVKAIFL